MLCNFNATIPIKDYLFLNRINLTNRLSCLSKRHGLCTWQTRIHNKIISPGLRKKRCFQSYNRGYRKSGKS